LDPDDHTYVDIQISYDPSKDNGNGTPAYFSSTFTQSVVDNPSQYHLVIDRWDCNCSQIPSYIFDPNIPGTVTLAYNGTEVSQDLIFIPESPVSGPIPPLKPYRDYTVAELIYYYIYTVEYYAELVNTAFTTAHAALIILEPAIAASLPPRLVFNPETQLFALYAEKAFYDKSVALPITVMFDDEIASLLPFFVWRYQGSNKWLLQISDILINTVSYGGVDYLKQQQQSFGCYTFNPSKSIVFTSGTIPIKNTFSQINNKDPNNSNASSIAILTDFKVDITSAMDQSKQLIYISNDNFRRIDLYGTSPLRTLDLAVYWTDKVGNLLPLNLAEDETLGIKLLFIRKNSNFESE
jgi:hypothetical protein